MPAPAPAAEPAPAPAAEPAAAPAPATPAVAQQDGDTASLISELVTLETIRRKSLDSHGFASLEAARKALAAGDYELARDQYKQALEFIGNRPATQAARDEAKAGMAEAFYLDAKQAMKAADVEKALPLAAQAKEYGHPQAERMIEALKRQPPKAEADTSSISHRVNEEEYKTRRDEIRRRLRRSRQYYTTAEYDKALEECELILRDHAHEVEAMELRDRIADRMKAIEIDKGDGCVAPTADTIADGSYPLSRSLFIYVNKASLADNPAVGSYVSLYLSDEGIAQVTEAGYVSIPADRLETSRSTWDEVDTEGDMVVAWIDHGVAPTDGDYEYMLVVRATPAAIQGLAAEPPYRVLQRDRAAHIVWDTQGHRWNCVLFLPQELAARLKEQPAVTPARYPDLFP